VDQKIAVNKTNFKGHKMRKEKNEEVESKAMQKREDKQMIQLRNGIYEVKRELKKHESEPMNKAHPSK